MTETDRKDYLKQVAKDNREQALIWAEDKTDAQLLDALVEQRDIVDDITREAEEKAAQRAFYILNKKQSIIEISKDPA